MKINRNTLKRPTLEEFADKHDLTLEIGERPKEYGLPRYFAYLKDVYLDEGCVVVGTSGNGDDEQSAVQDYVKRLNGQLLTIRPFDPSRRKKTVVYFAEAK